jgi:hypothetical protein
MFSSKACFGTVHVLAQDNADRVRKWTKAAMVVVGINSKIILSSP